MYVYVIVVKENKKHHTDIYGNMQRKQRRSSMLSKEEIEKDNTFKISVPLITDEEIRNIDNNFEDIVNEFTKSYVKEKDLVIAQHIMQKQQNKISQLESDNYELNNRINDYIEERQKLIEKLEEVCEKVDNEMADFEVIDLKHKILEILKGE